MKATLFVLGLMTPALALAVGTWGGGDPPDADGRFSVGGFLLLAAVVGAVAASGKGEAVVTFLVAAGSIGGIAMLAYLIGGPVGLLIFGAVAAWWWFKK